MCLFPGKWRPRRTIIFCSWGAEEYGLVGSTEWVEVGDIIEIYLYLFILLLLSTCLGNYIKATEYKTEVTYKTKRANVNVVSWLSCPKSLNSLVEENDRTS